MTCFLTKKIKNQCKTMMHLSPGVAARLEEIWHSFPLNWLKWYSEIADTSKYVVGGHTAILILCSYIQGL
jgi:hypothetical protein